MRMSSAETQPWPPIPAKPVRLVADSDGRSESSREPTLLDGLLDEWPLYRRLDGSIDVIGALEKLGGRAQVAFTVLRKNALLGVSPTLRPTFSFSSGGVVPFRDYAAALRRAMASKTGAVYMQSVSIRNLPGFGRTVRRLPQLRGARAFPYRIWIGSGAHRVTLHHDPYENYLCVLAGQKRVVMFPPAALPNLYPAPLDCAPAGAPVSLIDLRRIQRDNFPRFPAAARSAVATTVNAGQVLRIPPFWWHYVESVGLNVMVNSWVAGIDEGVFQSQFELPFVRTLLAHATEKEGALARKWRSVHDRLDAANGDCLPEEWIEARKLYFGYFAFRTCGDPYPTVKGEFDRWIRRVRQSLRSGFRYATPRGSGLLGASRPAGVHGSYAAPR